MRHLLTAVAPVVVSLYITAGNIMAFRPSAMRFMSLAGLVLVGLALGARPRTDGFSAIDRGFFIYMALNVLVFWAFPASLGGIAADFPTGILFAVFLVITAGPALFAGRYFTEYFAKKTSPEAVWNTDIFKTINRRMTRFWAVIFGLSAFVTTIPFFLDMEGSILTGLFFQIVLPGLLMLGIGRPFNKKYPAYYQRKMGIEPVHGAKGVETDAPAPGATPPTLRNKEDIVKDQPNVVAINGSPHEAVGNTSQMLQMVASALSREGVAMEEISLAGKNIEYCIGCGVCLEKGRCWRKDDYAAIAEKLLAADGIIFASPVYFSQVTAQMKTFIDRSLGYGHKPRTTWKPGLAVSVSGGRGETEVARYLGRTLHVFGAFPVGTLTALALNPGAFLEKDVVEARAGDLARDLARAIKEKRRYPATDEDLTFYLFMRNLVTGEKEFMRDDYRHWQETGLTDGFETYVQQRYGAPNFDPEFRKEWLKEIIRAANETNKAKPASPPASSGPRPDLSSVMTCRGLLEMMPAGFNKEAAGDLSAVYQFEVTGPEEFIGRLKIEGGTCVFHEGPDPRPDVVIKTPADIWLAISKGELDGQHAFMAGKYKTEGSVPLLMKLKHLFG
jgi:multimeric flavodoxin WrbA/putative sterol carrier protein